jgi:hypothetical protein
MQRKETPKARNRNLDSSHSQNQSQSMMTSMLSLTKENEELRTYIEVLKSSLDTKAYNLGLGDKKVYF